MSTNPRIYRPSFFARLFGGAKWQVVLDGSSPSIMILTSRGETELYFSDIQSVRTIAGFPWSTVEIQFHGVVAYFPGLSGVAAKVLTSDIVEFVDGGLKEIIKSEAAALLRIDAAIGAITKTFSRYLSNGDLRAALAAVPADAARAFDHPMFDIRRLAATIASVLPSSFALLTDQSARHAYNTLFVKHELNAFRPLFDDMDGRSLSVQQREACVRLEDNNLLVASAGSGKSATIVGKVAYILEKELARPEEVLVLAFNKSAADELKERIASQLGVEPDSLECRVTTFHALGRSIIHDVEGRPPQLANWVEHPAGEAKALEEIVEQLTRSDTEFLRLWLELLIVHPKADKPRESFDSEADYVRYITDRQTRGGATIGSFAGIYVKSLQEQSIANWLWLNSVEFEYERQVEILDEEGTPFHIHPDFYYPATDTVHEHFALDHKGRSPFENYAVQANAKRRAYAAADIDFFETLSAQASDGTLLGDLRIELGQRGFEFRQRDITEIADALRPVVLKHYHALIGTCVKHIRASKLTLDTLLDRAEGLQDKARARIFARVVHRISEVYTAKLVDAERIDFDSMIGDATQSVETGKYVSPYTMILVDEFQDISKPRADLVKALRVGRPFTKLFAVGDDWQSINRFAGSEVSLFTKFGENFGAGWQGRLEQTYRCNQLIADTAAGFVQRNPAQLKKSVRSVRPAISKSIRVVPVKGAQSKPDFSVACMRVLSRLDAFLGGVSDQWRNDADQKLKVMVLWRYNHLDPFVGGIPVFEHIKVSALSFHRSKGLEADYTVLMDISEGDYGVPSRIEDDELLTLAIPDVEIFPYAEERRLFYVALTRASRGVFILTDADRPSRYIRELCEISGNEIRFEAVDGQQLEQCPTCKIGQLTKRRSKKGHSFVGCNQYPDCRHTAPLATFK